MAIADTIQSMYDNVSNAYNVLEVAGADLTNVDKNILNLKTTWQERLLYFMNNGTDVVWNNWDKVTGEGTTLTLNNTEEAPMKINLKGNTSQATTTGKNLLPPLDSGSQSGLTFTTNSNGITTISGTTTGGVSYYKNVNKILPAGTYTLSVNLSYTLPANSSQLILQDNSVRLATINLWNMTSKTFTLSADTEIKNYYFYSNSGIQHNGTISIQLERGSIATEFEPYTNGASPNPDYPQDIHVVSGDNSINVVGKNYFNNNLPSDIKAVNCSQTFNDGKIVLTATGADIRVGEVFNAGTSWISEYGELIPVKPNTKYSIKITNSLINKNFITYCNKEKVSIGTFTFFNQFATFTTPNDTQYVCFRIGYGSATSGTSYSFNVMLVEGEYTTQTIPDYEPYQGNTYPIYLGVENYLPNNATTQTINGITYTINEDKSIKINGTASGRADLWLYGSTTDTGNYVFIPKGNYTISTANLNDGTMFLSFREKTAGVRYLTRQNNEAIELLAQQDCYFYGIMLGVESGKTINNLTFYPQIEKGTKLNSFTPYGTTPIELCKIGDYQDSIKKSTGKNLIPTQVDKWEQGSISASGNVSSTARIRTIDYYPIKNDTNYYISIQNTNYCYLNVYLYNSNKQYIEQYYTYDTSINGTTSKVINIPSTFVQNVAYMRAIIRRSDNTSTITANEITTIRPMVNEGSTALPYEPYGTGWYVKKEIGKVVFTGGDDETWNISETSTSGSNRFLNESIANLVTKPSADSVTINTLSNNFVAKSANQTYLNQEGIDISKIGNLHIYSDTTKNYTVAQFKTWLSTHNTIVYYPLATPTYTEITDSTLISQLNALAKSYNSQTNISQESNDLASLLNATALEEME